MPTALPLWTLVLLHPATTSPLRQLMLVRLQRKVPAT
jgi:hypothetical protein